MRIRKAFMALNAGGHIIRAVDVNPVLDECYTCHHCHCPLVYHPTGGGEAAWFEHDLSALSEVQLKQCAYYKGDSLIEQRQRTLQHQLQQSQPLAAVYRWHCLICDFEYVGAKPCPICRKGIYSREVRADDAVGDAL
ncbi:putative zinc ribbon protein [Citrobacter farmeri]